MPLPEQFWERLPQKSDLELCEILQQPQKYLPEALDAVQRELQKRGVGPERIRRLFVNATESRARRAQLKAEPPQNGLHFGAIWQHFLLWPAAVWLVRKLIYMIWP